LRTLTDDLGEQMDTIAFLDPQNTWAVYVDGALRHEINKGLNYGKGYIQQFFQHKYPQSLVVVK
jgi:hypothetical protein